MYFNSAKKRIEGYPDLDSANALVCDGANNSDRTTIFLLPDRLSFPVITEAA